MCGGPSRLSLFFSKTDTRDHQGNLIEVTLYGQWVTFSCYTGNIAARTLLTLISVDGDRVTLRRCVDADRSAATFRFAGVEYGNGSIVFLS